MTTGLRIAPHQLEPLDGTGTHVPDGTYGVSVVGGSIEGLTPPPVAATLTPLVTVVDGVPGLVFDDDGEIVYTEAP